MWEDGFIYVGKAKIEYDNIFSLGLVKIEKTIDFDRRAVKRDNRTWMKNENESIKLRKLAINGEWQ